MLPSSIIAFRFYASCNDSSGLCAFSPNLDACFMAIPASTTRGSVLLYNVMELQSHCEVMTKPLNHA